MKDHEIEIPMSFDCLILFKRNEHREEHCIRKPNDEIEDKKHIYVRDKVVSFETNVEIVT